jgi:hypothetical protein
LYNDAVTGVAVNGSGQVALTGSYSDLIVLDTKALTDKFDTSIPGANILVATLDPVSGVQDGFDGASQTEPAVFNPTTQTWTVLTTAGPISYGHFGWPGDIPVPGDWAQYGHAELAVYRPSTAQWVVELANGSTQVVATFGAAQTDMPVPGDYDAVGETEAAVYRPSTGQWFVKGPFSNHVVGTLGQPGDVPVPGDYDRVGYTEPAVFRPSTGQWLVLGPNGVHQVAVFGNTNLSDIPVPGDYDRVGHTEPAIFRPSTGQWFAFGPNGGHLVATFGGTNLQTNYPLEGVPGSLMALSQIQSSSVKHAIAATSVTPPTPATMTPIVLTGTPTPVTISTVIPFVKKKGT